MPEALSRLTELDCESIRFLQFWYCFFSVMVITFTVLLLPSSESPSQQVYKATEVIMTLSHALEIWALFTATGLILLSTTHFIVSLIKRRRHVHRYNYDAYPPRTVAEPTGSSAPFYICLIVLILNGAILTRDRSAMSLPNGNPSSTFPSLTHLKDLLTSILSQIISTFTKPFTSSIYFSLIPLLIVCCSALIIEVKSRSRRFIESEMETGSLSQLPAPRWAGAAAAAGRVGDVHHPQDVAFNAVVLAAGKGWNGRLQK